MPTSAATVPVTASRQSAFSSVWNWLHEHGRADDEQA